MLPQRLEIKGMKHYNFNFQYSFILNITTIIKKLLRVYFARATRYFGLRGVSGTYLTGGHGSNSTWLTS